jgi:hypothetical protein
MPIMNHRLLNAFDTYYHVTTGIITCFYHCNRFSWEWLPGFGGQPLRINKLTSGTGEFSSSIFIGGEFNPPVLVWTVSYYTQS